MKESSSQYLIATRTTSNQIKVSDLPANGLPEASAALWQLLVHSLQFFKMQIKHACLKFF